MARIALDAMGGDHAPRTPVSGALLALLELDGRHIIQLVGQQQVIEQELEFLLGGELREAAGHRERLTIVDAPDVVGMTDKPTSALRSKPNSSMVLGIRMQTTGDSDAFVSAGNTGAQMAASTVLLRLHAGLTRPAVGALFPTARETLLLIDGGANIDCTAAELMQFARLGAVYAEDVLGRNNPSIGLLSIGEEAEKGNALVKETHQMLLGAGLNFQGNIEGRDIPLGESARGRIDVVVCDGFVGNVVLKFYEEVAPMIVRLVGVAANADQKALESSLKKLDYSEYGGAPLLGVRGISIIAHGRSSPRAIKNALKVAVRAVESGMNEHIGRRMSEPVPGAAVPRVES